jgi:hypothetical protein
MRALCHLAEASRAKATNDRHMRAGHAMSLSGNPTFWQGAYTATVGVVLRLSLVCLHVLVL